MLELKCGIIGMGNMGCQSATIAARDFKIPALAVNSSARDLDMVTHATTILMGEGRGTGKSRDLAKQFMESHIEPFLDDTVVVDLIEQNDIIFIINSTGGGWGSGGGLLLTNILRSVYPNKLFILAFTFSSINESLASQQHTLEMLEELEILCPDLTYMAYDNDKYLGLPQSEIFKRVNEDIIKDIEVIIGRHNLATSLSSIDENDMLRLIRVPGRLVVGRVDTVKAKDVSDKGFTKLIRYSLERSSQAELEENPACVQGLGFICNLDNIFDEYIGNITKDLQVEFGDCVSDYSHIRVNFDGGVNEAYVILSGWHLPSRRIEKILTKQKELQALAVSAATERKSIVTGNVLSMSDINGTNASNRGIVSAKEANTKNKVNLADLMAGFKR